MKWLQKSVGMMAAEFLGRDGHGLRGLICFEVAKLVFSKMLVHTYIRNQWFYLVQTLGRQG